MPSRPARASAPTGAEARAQRPTGAVRPGSCRFASPARQARSGRPSSGDLSLDQPAGPRFSRLAAARAAAGRAPSTGAGARRRTRSLDGSARWCARRARPGARGRSRRGPPARRSAAPRRRGGQKRAGMSRSCVAPDEQGRRAELGEPGVEAAFAVAARRGRCCGRRRRRRRAPRASGRCGRTRRRRRRRRPDRAARVGRTGSRTGRGRRARAADGGSTASSGRSSLDQRRELAPAKGERGREQAQRGDPLGRVEGDLDRDPAAHRVADQVGALDPDGVHVAAHRGREPGRVVAAARRLGGAAEAGQVDRVHGVLGRQRGDRLEERGLVRAEAVQADHLLGPVAGDQGRDPAPPVCTSAIRSSGARPPGSRNRPSKPSARSRSPRA